MASRNNKTPFYRKCYKLLVGLLMLPYALTLLYLWVNPPSTLMLAGLLSGQKAKREWVNLENISPNLIAAVLTAEDDTFCDHNGINFTQMEKSIEKAASGNKKIRGASTISQQTAKNLFLWQGRSWVRKILEVPLTFWIELLWSKHRILEVYLNIAEWGKNIYGVQAASKATFGIPAQKLSYGQSALLASALPNPIKRNTVRPGSGQLLYSQQILSRLQKSRPDMSCLGK